MSKIKIVGSQGLHDLAEVKESVIELGGEYFWRHDRENLVKVKLPEGKYRLYRTKSPLIVKTVDGEYARKRDCIKMDEGDVWFSKHSPNLVTVDGKPTHKDFTVCIKNKYYLKSDPNIVKIYEGRKAEYDFKENTVQLDPDIYGNGILIRKTDPNLVESDGKYYKLADCFEFMTVKNGEPVFTIKAPTRENKALPVREVFKGFKDRTNPQVARYDHTFTARQDAIVDEETGMWYHRDLIAIQKPLVLAVMNKVILDNIAKAKQKFDSNFDDADEEENNPKKWSTEYQTWGGKQHLFGQIGDPIVSSAFTKLGGLRYSFGAEIETSGGLLNKRLAGELGVEAVGDRSIGSAEYVTGILHGNNGVDFLKTVMDHIHNYCMVDKRCGSHFHIGQLRDDNTLRFPEIKFDKSFAIGAIKLGTQIEEDLYKILPPSRSPYNYHCSSIMRYKDIDEDNWRDYLGCFLFGPREDEIRKRGTIDMTQFSYGTPGQSCKGLHKM
jgi:hypothetical protein